MSALDLCTRETVDIATEFGSRPIPAWRYSDLACHEGVGAERGRWCITHLPTGQSFNSLGNFLNVDDACQAMLAVSRISNNWSAIAQEDLPRIGIEARRIFAENGAVKCKATDIARLRKIANRQFDKRINGYTNAEASA